MNLWRYIFSQSYRKHRWLRQHLSKLRALYKAMAPYFKALKSIQLPPRYPMGDKRNINRVFEVSKALHQIRASNDPKEGLK